MENNSEQTLPHLTQFTNSDELVLGIDANPNEQKPAGDAELMTPGDALGLEEDE